MYTLPGVYAPSAQEGSGVRGPSGSLALWNGPLGCRQGRPHDSGRQAATLPFPELLPGPGHTHNRLVGKHSLPRCRSQRTCPSSWGFGSQTLSTAPRSTCHHYPILWMGSEAERDGEPGGPASGPQTAQDRHSLPEGPEQPILSMKTFPGPRGTRHGTTVACGSAPGPGPSVRPGWLIPSHAQGCRPQPTWQCPQVPPGLLRFRGCWGHLCSGSWRKHGKGSCSLDPRYPLIQGYSQEPSPPPGEGTQGDRQCRGAGCPRRCRSPGLRGFITFSIISKKTQLTAFFSKPSKDHPRNTRPDLQPTPLATSRKQLWRPATQARSLCAAPAHQLQVLPPCDTLGTSLSVPPAPPGQEGRAQWGLDQVPILVCPMTCPRSSHQWPNLHPGRRVPEWRGVLSCQEQTVLVWLSLQAWVPTPRVHVGHKALHPKLPSRGPKWGTF